MNKVNLTVVQTQNIFAVKTTAVTRTCCFMWNNTRRSRKSCLSTRSLNLKVSQMWKHCTAVHNTLGNDFTTLGKILQLWKVIMMATIWSFFTKIAWVFILKHRFYRLQTALAEAFVEGWYMLYSFFFSAGMLRLWNSNWATDHLK